MKDAMSRRTFLRNACTLAAVQLVPAGLISQAWAGTESGSDTAENDGSCLFALSKGLLRDNGATPWFARIALGSPEQPMTVMMDTGTSNLWVTSFCCSSAACATKQYKYDYGESSSHERSSPSRCSGARSPMPVTRAPTAARPRTKSRW